MTAAVLGRPNVHVRTTFQHVVLHLVKATLCLGIVGIGHLPEANISQSEDSPIVGPVNNEKVLLLQIAKEIRVLKIALREIEIIEAREGHRLLGASIRLQTDGLGLDTRLLKLGNLGTFVHSQDLFGDTRGNVLGFGEAIASLKLILAAAEERLEATPHKVEERQARLVLLPLDDFHLLEKTLGNCRHV